MTTFFPFSVAASPTKTLSSRAPNSTWGYTRTASLARFNQPLEKATSASLAALEAANEGVKLLLAGNPQAALPLFLRQVELDPNLGGAYEGIGAANGALHHYDRMAASFTRAYQLRDRMTEKNRLNIELLYYSHVTGNLTKPTAFYFGLWNSFLAMYSFILICRRHCLSSASSNARPTQRMRRRGWG
jgi:tetratricopeptide (TPR) repeat protein